MEFLFGLLLYLVLLVVNVFYRGKNPREAAGRIAARLKGVVEINESDGDVRVFDLTLGGRPAWIEFDSGDVENLRRPRTRVRVNLRDVSPGRPPTVPEGALRRMGDLKKATVDLDEDHLTVSVVGWVADEDRLLELVRATEELVTCVLGASAIQMDEMRLSGEGRCPVCRSGLRDASVRCENCRTLHHAECWTYMGRCSTYACKGRRAVA